MTVLHLTNNVRLASPVSMGATWTKLGPAHAGDVAVLVPRKGELINVCEAMACVISIAAYPSGSTRGAMSGVCVVFPSRDVGHLAVTSEGDVSDAGRSELAARRRARRVDDTVDPPTGL